MYKSLCRNTIFTLLLFFVGYQSIFATHIIGGEMNYKCLGNNDYQISLTVYRDCFYGIAKLDDTAYIAVYGIEGILLDTLPILLGKVDTIIEIDECLIIPPNICVETTTYIDTITLLPRIGGYELAYQRCCRNETILNVADPLNTGATYNIKLTEAAMVSCNISPVVTNWPATFICVNQPFIFNHAAYDANGDSLNYRLCTPLDGGIPNDNPRPRPAFPPPFDTILWNSPTYGLDNLLSGIPLEIDAKTGIITGTPNLIGQFVVGVCIDEYRNGELLSTTRRDFQYNVVPCENVLAQFEVPFEQCDNLTVQPINQTNGNPEGYLWKFYTNDSTLLTTSIAPFPTYTFADYGNYFIRLIINPDGMCSDSIDHSVFLRPNDLIADFRFEISGCTDSLTIEINEVNTLPLVNINEIEWELIGDLENHTSTDLEPVFVLKNSQFVTLTMIINPSSLCPTAITKSFRANLLADIKLEENISICQGESIALNPFGNFPSYVYNWKPIHLIDNPTSENPIAHPNQTTTFQVSYMDSLGLCQIEKSITVFVKDTLPKISAIHKIQCDGRLLQLTPNSNGLIQYDFGDNSSKIETRTDSFITHFYQNSGNFQVNLKYISQNICPDSTSLTIELPEDNLFPNFEWNVEACEQNVADLELIDLSNTSFGEITQRKWKLSNGLTAIDKSPLFSIEKNEAIIANLIITLDDDENCKDSIQMKIPSLLIEETIADSILACVGNTIQLNPDYNSNYSYLWSPKVGLSDANSPNPSLQLSDDAQFFVQISNEFDCMITDSVFTNIHPAIEIDAIPIPVVCDTTDIVLFAESEQSNQLYWQNEMGDTLGFEPELLINVDQSQNYTVTFHDDNNCQNNATIEIEFNPVLLDYEQDQASCLNQEKTLIINNLQHNSELKFDWIPNQDILAGATTSMPVIKPEEPTTFTFIAGNESGCKATGAIFVDILPLPILAVDATPSSIYAGESTQLNATDIPEYIYQWNPSNSLNNETIPNPIAHPLETTNYIVTVENEYGCLNSAQIKVNVNEGICDFPYIFVPSGFTPNGDGENDILFVRGPFIDEMTFYVYDRWGDKVFETKDQSIGWDGNHNGKELPSGVFGYYLNALCKDGMIYKKQGNVTLIR